MKWLAKTVTGEAKLIDFSTTPPTVSPVIPTFGQGGEEEVNIMTDAAHNLLFCSAGNSSNIIHVRDANLNMMPNGYIRGNHSSLESAICKVPCTADQYYFFNYAGGPTGQDSLFYSIVDMSLNGGLGDVIQNNTYLGSGFTEGMTISHQMRNGCRWLIIPGYSGNNFTLNALKISHTGVSAAILLDTHPMVNIILTPREVELSKDNLKIAVTTFCQGSSDPDILLYDFDLENCALSNKQTFSVSPQRVLGIEFSPDATQLYYQTNTNTAPSTLGRVELSTGTNQVIDNNREQYHSDPELAANGKIYIGWNYTDNFMSEIADPNNPAVGNIQYTRNSIFINATGCRPGHVNMIDGEPPGTFITPTTIDFSFTSTGNCGEVLFNDSSCLGSWWEWDFGDSNFSNLENPTHTYNIAGTYNVTHRILVCSDTLTITKQVTVSGSNLTLSTTPDTISCNNAPVTLQVNGATNYTWSPATGLNTTTGNIVTANPSTTTTYTVTGSNGGTCSSTSTITVSVINPTASIISGTTNGCAGSSLVLHANGNGNYLWSNGSTADSISVSQTGTYTLQVSDSGCIASDSISINFSNGPTATLNVSNPNSVCAGDTSAIDLTGSSISQVQWYYNGTLLPDTSFQFYATVTGNYSVIVTDSLGCTSTTNVNLNFIPQPQATFNTNNTPCLDSIGVQNSSTGASTYEWYIDGILTDTTPNPYFHFTSVGNHLISLVAFNNNCIDSVSQTIVTYANANAEFAVDSACSLTKYFQNTSTNSTNYTWNFGNGDTTNQTSPVYTFPAYGTYNINLVASNSGGCADSVSMQLVLAQHVSSVFNYEFDTCANELRLTPAYTIATQYSWDFGDNTVSNSSITSHNYSAPGIYTVSLLTNEDFSCPDLTSMDIVIPETHNSHLYIPNTFTPNGDGINDVFQIFGLGLCDHYELYIYNKWGQLIHESNDSGIAWNGFYKNKIVEQDVYCYLIKMDGEYKQGSITVLY